MKRGEGGTEGGKERARMCTHIKCTLAKHTLLPSLEVLKTRAETRREGERERGSSVGREMHRETERD